MTSSMSRWVSPAGQGLGTPGRLLRIAGSGTGGAGRRPARWRRRRRGIPWWGSHALPRLLRAWRIVRLGSGLPWPWSSSGAVGAWLSGLASERQPAEGADGDEKARGSPARHDQQVWAREAEPRGVRVVGDEQRVGQVPDREDLSYVRQPVRQCRAGDEHPGDEVERQQKGLGSG